MPSTPVDPLPSFSNLRHSISTQTDPISKAKCNCTSNCCIIKRENNPLYVPELDPWRDICNCNVPNEKISYKFLIPFLLAMSLSVMQCGAVYVDVTNEME
jgi:hypothetical protein